MRSPSAAAFVLPLLAALAGATAPAAAQPAAEGALVTVLGDDTLAVERWTRAPGRVTAEAAVRAPRATLRRYVLELDDEGRMTRFREETRDPSAPAGPARVDEVAWTGGAWRRTVTEGDATRASAVEGGPDALPFVDLVHWPLELALARLADADSVTQPLLAGTRALPFTLVRRAPGEVVVTHPFRGPSVVTVDADGRLRTLDAAATTRKVVVTRVPAASVDVEGAARRWAAADRAGRGMGELSGRAEARGEVEGATVTVDYGTPSARGRAIFGGIVPWGQVWRTGANRATHLATDRDLVLGTGDGALVVPAGEYTLFSVPAPDGGWLIVNRETGQNGTAYDPARDLGRVPMRRAAAADAVERFTIRVVPGCAGGSLVLAWDRDEFAVPFTVR